MSDQVPPADPHRGPRRRPGGATAEAVRPAADPLAAVPRQAAGAEIVIRDPRDGTLVGHLAPSTAEEAVRAIERARANQPGWRRTPAARRAAALREVAARLRRNAEDLAALNARETGRPLTEAREGVAAGVATLEQYAELGPLHRGRSLMGDPAATDVMVAEPRGVVVVLTPWNDPVAVSCGLVGAALATGNTVVYKASERSPFTGRLFAELAAADLPEGVLAAVHGGAPMGAALVADPRVDVVAHVGSTRTGRAIREVAGRTGAKALLENGGNDPLIVDAGVDPAWAAEQAALGSFANSGQICTSVERIYVHRSLAEPFLDLLTEQAARRVPESAAEEEVEMGPLVDRAHRDHVHAHVRAAVEAGARCLVGGELPEGPGAYYPATVLTGCTPDMALLREETFGPVAPVRIVDGFDQALLEAADDRYGLAATVLTASMEHAQRAFRELPVGTVKVNAVFGGAPGGAAHPRRGSGQGYGYGPELLDEMTVTKVLHLGLPRRADPAR
ncbi:aldehyde dehydrogenase family protein [Marinitenerispora sediminis]|uniref:aldehyde dehydrogenase family protein n=1 Tax=Marinitenerispora sediminis TaxID=1931232 RepID=UPI001C698BD7|nr:aldehyde dehydrogenase family protein [Marinitenerispora sediminis]